MNSILELLGVIVIVLIPTVPACLFLSSAIERRRRRRAEVTSGRAPETPFVVLASVGSLIAVVAVLAVAMTLLARAVA